MHGREMTTLQAVENAQVNRDLAALGRDLDAFFQDQVVRFAETVPYASHLTGASEPLNETYYIRHRIETIKRIWLTSRLDALALAQMVEEDYECARPWARYACEELDHDRLFLADLAAHGVDEDRVRKEPLFPATVEMVNMMERGIETDGSLPVVSYSLIVEWNSLRYSRLAVDRAARRFSERHVHGARSHLGIDYDEDHYDMILFIVHRLITKGKYSESGLLDYLTEVSQYLQRYFKELYSETVQ